MVLTLVSFRASCAVVYTERTDTVSVLTEIEILVIIWCYSAYVVIGAIRHESSVAVVRLETTYVIAVVVVVAYLSQMHCCCSGLTMLQLAEPAVFVVVRNGFVGVGIGSVGGKDGVWRELLRANCVGCSGGNCLCVWASNLKPVCMYVCVSVCMDGCLYVCMFLLVCLYVCMYESMRVCMYVRIYVCTYVRMLTYIQSDGMQAYMRHL